jgi:hypothetical protein
MVEDPLVFNYIYVLIYVKFLYHFCEIHVFQRNTYYRFALFEFLFDWLYTRDTCRMSRCKISNFGCIRRYP